MNEALVEQDPDHLDPQDMAVVLAALDDIAVTSQAAETVTRDPADAWTLRVHWLQRGPVASDTEVALPAVLDRIREHFTARGRTPPARMELRGPDHQRLLTIEAGATSV